MLTGRFALDNKPKVLESVAACRRIERNIQTGFENRQETPTSWLTPDTI
jgi:hypothetical protein